MCVLLKRRASRRAKCDAARWQNYESVSGLSANLVRRHWLNKLDELEGLWLAAASVHLA